MHVIHKLKEVRLNLNSADGKYFTHLSLHSSNISLIPWVYENQSFLISDIGLDLIFIFEIIYQLLCISVWCF